MENKREYNRSSAKVKLLSKELKKTSKIRTTGDLDLRKDGKKTWRLLDKLSGNKRKSKPVPLSTETGGKVYSDAKKADTQNKFYSSIKGKLRKVMDRSFKLLTKTMKKRSGPLASIFTDTFSFEELTQSLSKCKLKKAPGLDSVTNDMLVQLSTFGKEILLKLLNQTWKQVNSPKSGKQLQLSQS